MNSSTARRVVTTLTLATVAITGLAGCARPGGGPAASAPATKQPAPVPTEAGTIPSPTRSAHSSTHGSAPVVAHGAAGVACPVRRGWNTAPDDGGPAMSPAGLSRVRAGQHECYDRLVFDVAGSQPVGFTARYVPVVRADGSGKPVRVKGAAALQVVVRAPIADGTALRIGDAMVPATGLGGLRSVEAVSYAGSFEGQTTVAVGVWQRVPFRVWSLPDGGRQRVVVDVAS